MPRRGRCGRPCSGTASARRRWRGVATERRWPVRGRTARCASGTPAPEGSGRPGRAVGQGGGTAMTVWDCSGKGPEGSTPLSVKGHEEPLTAVAFQGKGPLLVSGGQDGRLLLFQPGKYKKGLAEVRLDSAVTQAV